MTPIKRGTARRLGMQPRAIRRPRRYSWQCMTDTCRCHTATGSCPRCGVYDRINEDEDGSLCARCERELLAEAGVAS